MAALTTYYEQSGVQPESDIPCQVAAFYEDVPTRGRLIHFCDQLFKEVGAEIEFAVDWWKYRFLSDAVIASLCSQSASQADLVIFSVYAVSEPPAQVKAVNEIWLNQRENREGLLMLLLDAENAPTESPPAALVYFREIAERAQLEFVTQWFPAMPGSTGEAMEHITHRAHEVTPVLKEILDRSKIPLF